ncbi:MAG: peptidase, partial [Gemmatimonadetes bacterium]|nr:peptidase [Gemmatimonadota bacterium]
ALTREELAAAVAASPDDVRAVEAFAVAHGLTVGRVSLAERSVHLHGTASAMRAAFGVQLERAEVGDRTFRQRSGAVQIPTDLAAIITGVFGLDDREQATPHFRLHAQSEAARARAAGASFNGYLPSDLSAAYDFPEATGAKQCIALIELGGGYRTTDLNAYFVSLKVKTPKVVSISVDGALNAPTGNPNGPDGEVALDIEVAGGIAPAATIAVYFAPNTDRGFLDAIAMAVHDTRLKPSVISISWGAPESQWTTQTMNAMGELFREAAALGVPVFVAAGDNGASDGTNALVVDFPAASPAAIGCGGTRLEIAAGKRRRETVWNDGSAGGATGGGFSRTFTPPTYQHPYLPAQAPAQRGVPDLSANADPQTGYRILVDGRWQIIGGTSAVAPLMAGLIARCNEKGKRPLRDLNARLYGSAPARAQRKAPRPGAAGRRTEDRSARVAESATTTSAVSVPIYFTDIVVGNNGATAGVPGYSAREGWDACCGLGVPNGLLLLQSLWGVKGRSAKQLSS